jgi:acyl carrier protein
MMPPKSQTTSRTVADRSDVLQDVRQIVAEQMAVQIDEVDENTALVEDLGCDSLDIVEISMEVEEHFDISIPDEAGEKIRTIGELVDGVQRLLAGSITKIHTQ